MIRAFCLDEGNTLLERWLKQLEGSPSVALFILVIITSSDKVLIVAVVIEETGIDVDVDFILGVVWPPSDHTARLQDELYKSVLDTCLHSNNEV